MAGALSRPSLKLLLGVVVCGLMTHPGSVVPGELGRVRLAAADPYDLYRTSKNLGIIRAQLQLGLRYEQQALEMIVAGADRAKMGEVARIVEEGYKLIRFAENGVHNRMITANPHVAEALYGPARSRILEAMSRVRRANVAAREAAAGGVSSRWVETATTSLQSAIVLVEEALNLI